MFIEDQQLSRLNSREIESRFPILDEEDPQTSPVQQGKDDLLLTTPSKPTMQRQSGDAPPHQHEDSLQQDELASKSRREGCINLSILD